jgi:PAS domain S-box-containing protein
MTASEKDKLNVIHNILNGHEQYWTDLDGNILATNLEATTITGYEASEIVSKNISILYQEEDINSNIPHQDLNNAIKDGFYKTKGIRLKKNKSKFLATAEFESITRDCGRPAIKMTLHDTTYQSVQKHKLRQLESHFNSLFHNNFIGVLNLQKSDFKILLANSKANDILGEIELIGKYFTSYISVESGNSYFQQVVNLESIDDFELQLKRKSGSVCHVRVRCVYFSSEQMIEVLLFDITEDKRRIQELERINHHLDQFIYHISHDLRSPITTLLGLLQLSKKTKSFETIQNYLDLMIGRTEHLDSLLTDLASIAFNEKASLELEKIEFEKEAKSILTEYKSLNPSISLSLEVQQVNLFISDVSRVRPILKNLISNSIKYYNPSEERPFAKIAISVEKDHAKIEVTDNGIGIHSQHGEKIYTMFYRGTSNSSGSGLGLYIVMSMIEKLGGRISYTSIHTKGSTFTVIIPNHRKLVDHKTHSYAII